MAKAGSETKALLKLLLKLSKERINRKIEEIVDKQNKAGESTNTRDDYQFYKGAEAGLRSAMDCFNKIVSEIEL